MMDLTVERRIVTGVKIRIGQERQRGPGLPSRWSLSFKLPGEDRWRKHSYWKSWEWCCVAARFNNDYGAWSRPSFFYKFYDIYFDSYVEEAKRYRDSIEGENR